MSLEKWVFMGCTMMQNYAVDYCTRMQMVGRDVNGQALWGNIAKTLSPTADSQVSRTILVGGRGWGMKGTEFELPDRRPRKGRCSLFGGGCTHPDSLCRNRSSVTDLVTDLVPAGRMGLVFENFSCEASEDRAAVAGGRLVRLLPTGLPATSWLHQTE